MDILGAIDTLDEAETRMSYKAEFKLEIIWKMDRGNLQHASICLQGGRPNERRFVKLKFDDV